MILNEHNKEEFPPAHTAEHLLNQTCLDVDVAIMPMWKGKRAR